MSKKYSEEDLTPGEALVMEVLAARWRLGESLWTFDTRHGRWLDSLADKGLVQPMHGIVEKTLRASLTDAGKAYYWDKDVPSRGSLGRAHPLATIVPKKWLFSKKEAKKRVAGLVHSEEVK